MELFANKSGGQCGNDDEYVEIREAFRLWNRKAEGGTLLSENSNWKISGH